MKRKTFYNKSKYYINDIFINDSDDYKTKIDKLDKEKLDEDIEKFS